MVIVTPGICKIVSVK